MFRLFLVMIVVFVLLSISFTIIFTLKFKAKENNMKYQQGNCNELYDIYGEKYMKEYAV